MADQLDIVTLAEAKAELSINTSDTGFDAVIGMYVTAASRRIDGLCGPVVERAVTDRLTGGVHQRASVLQLTHYPVLSFTSVTEYAAGAAQVLTVETSSASTPTDYLFDAEQGLLYRRASGNTYWFPSGRDNVVVVYNAGRCADTGSADPLFKLGALLVLKKMWSGRTMSEDLLSGHAGASPFGGVPTFAIPNAVRELLADELRAPNVA